MDYAEREWFKQTFATRSESVTPFLVSFWQGTVELTPSSDTWVDTTRIEAKIINKRVATKLLTPEIVNELYPDVIKPSLE